MMAQKLKVFQSLLEALDLGIFFKVNFQFVGRYYN